MQLTLEGSEESPALSGLQNKYSKGKFDSGKLN